ncbi:hypothetical protein BDZ89DRAFT_1158848 [Hymenopellis radicata]|nr:hypothetical protein BDZ89DRAFT_1158848 [Hymenopellis radicata]
MASSLDTLDLTLTNFPNAPVGGEGSELFSSAPPQGVANTRATTSALTSATALPTRPPRSSGTALQAPSSAVAPPLPDPAVDRSPSTGQAPAQSPSRRR